MKRRPTFKSIPFHFYDFTFSVVASEDFPDPLSQGLGDRRNMDIFGDRLATAYYVEHSLSHYGRENKVLTNQQLEREMTDCTSWRECLVCTSITACGREGGCCSETLQRESQEPELAGFSIWVGVVVGIGRATQQREGARTRS